MSINYLSYQDQVQRAAKRLLERKAEERKTKSALLEPLSPPPAAAKPLNNYPIIEWTNYTAREVLADQDVESDSSTEEERYIYEETLGEGSFGGVVKALDTTRKCWIAIKTVLLDAGDNPIEYIQRESATLKLFRDNRVPHRLNWLAEEQWPDEDSISLVTELIPEKNIDAAYLSKKASQEELTFDEIITILRQSLEFLSSLKKLKIIHGDFKPDNMIYERLSRYLTVLDAGNAILPTDEVPEILQTREYRCPAGILGGPCEGTEDLWSLACIIYELLTKETLFKFDSMKSDSEHSGDETDICHLEMIHHQIGLPSPAYLKKCERAERFYTPAGLPENPPQENHTPKWDERLDQVARDKKIPPKQMGQLISLLRAMLKYENRATSEELLKSPLFEQDVCFHLAGGLPKEGQILIRRISKVFSSAVGAADMTIDLSSQVTRTCYHLPRDPCNRYEVSLWRTDQSLISKQQSDIKDGAILDLKSYFPQ
ncbi:MAG: protein kinase [Verrucomicrobia bacterium]|nr:protein kinase [Verrucomicrobiota bacterium]